jgi:signal peptidase I
MRDLATRLEQIADAGVTGITLHPLHDAGGRRKVRTRRAVAVFAGVGLLVAAIAIAGSVRSDPGHPAILGGSGLVADASYRVPSQGMSPTLEIGDVVSGATKFGSVERGDVVRMHVPPTGVSAPAPPDAADVFKRVIGLPGDAVEGRGGAVFVNDRELTEPYAVGVTSDFARVVVPRHRYFVLGDNRPNSKDSREWGPVRGTEIFAIALHITAPADRAGPIAGSPR